LHLAQLVSPSPSPIILLLSLSPPSPIGLRSGAGGCRRVQG
jgi:hypothetical protein